MRVLVTGAGGQLGGDLVAALGRGEHEPIPVTHDACDIATPNAVDAVLDEYEPDVLVNCAAYTRVDAAEDDVEAAYRVNAMGPRVLAAACAERHLLLCHLSTDFVFDGETDGTYHEWAMPRPLSVYGASKMAGEREVRTLCPRHLIVRTSWLFGRSGPNFVLTMLRLARERGALRVVADQHGSPTWTGHLAPALVRLLELDEPGTYHLTNAGETTWHGLATETVSAAGLEVAVEAITTADYPTPARRPRRSVLDNLAWRLLGQPPLPDWREGVRAYMAGQDAAGSIPA